ncbi:MAG: S8 family serine peptidase, partial [Actinomycetota bacterium]
MRPRSIRYAVPLVLATLLALPVQAAAQAAPAPADSPDGHDSVAFASGRVLVRFAEGSSGRARRRALDASGARRSRTIPGASVEIVSIAAGSETAVLETLRRDPAVAAADLDWRRRAFDHVPGEVPWGVQTVRAPQVWSNVTGRGVTVAIVDSGVDLSHPDLVNSIATNTGETGTDESGRDRRTNGIDDDSNQLIDDWRGWDFAAGDASPLDVVGHGTGVAGVVAAAHDGLGLTGVAPGAKILPVRVLDDEGGGFDSDIIAGIVYAADQGARIINLSLGAPTYSQAMRSAVDYAAAQGALVVAAAGNGATPSPVVAYPAGYQNVLSVGAINQSGAPAPFSLTGKVDVAAPGQAVPVARLGGGTEMADGTSFAAPHVAGVVALLAERHPLATGRRLRQITAGTATDVGTPGYDVRTGAGIVNAEAAVGNTEPLMTLTGRPRVIAGNGSTTSTLTVAVTGPDGLPVGADQHLTFAGDGVTPETVEAVAAGDGTAATHLSSTAGPGSTGRVDVTWLEGARTLSMDFTITGPDDDIPGVSVPTPASRQESVGPGVDRDVVAISACAGERVKVELRSADTEHFLTATAYDGGSVFDTEPIAFDFGPVYPVVLDVVVPASGVLYVAVEAWRMDTVGPPARGVGYGLVLKRQPKATAGVSHTHISPNGDGVHDSTAISFKPLVTGPMTLRIQDRTGATLQQRDFGTVPAGQLSSFAWGGTRNDGPRVPDGWYAVVVDWAGSCPWQWRASISVDTARPLVWGVSDTDPFYPVPDGYKDSTRIWFELNEGAEVLIRIHPWGSGRVVRTLRAWKQRGISSIEWNGRDDTGRLVAAGAYEYQFWLTDYARNMHLPASGKHTVVASGKRLVGKRITLQRRAAEVSASGSYDL